MHQYHSSIITDFNVHPLILQIVLVILINNWMIWFNLQLFQIQEGFQMITY